MLSSFLDLVMKVSLLEASAFSYISVFIHRFLNGTNISLHPSPLLFNIILLICEGLPLVISSLLFFPSLLFMQVAMAAWLLQLKGAALLWSLTDPTGQQSEPAETSLVSQSSILCYSFSVLRCTWDKYNLHHIPRSDKWWFCSHRLVQQGVPSVCFGVKFPDFSLKTSRITELPKLSGGYRHILPHLCVWLQQVCAEFFSFHLLLRLSHASRVKALHASH